MDYAASTPVDEEVLREMLPYFREEFGNPSSTHTFGERSSEAVEVARERVAGIIKANKE